MYKHFASQGSEMLTRIKVTSTSLITAGCNRNIAAFTKSTRQLVLDQLGKRPVISNYLGTKLSWLLVCAKITLYEYLAPCLITLLYRNFTDSLCINTSEINHLTDTLWRRPHTMQLAPLVSPNTSRGNRKLLPDSRSPLYSGSAVTTPDQQDWHKYWA